MSTYFSTVGLARVSVIVAMMALAACAHNKVQGTLASLATVKPDVKDVKIEGSLEKALQSYQHFLKETPETAMTPEAIRRLADLKIEKEYSVTPDSVETPAVTASTEAKASTSVNAPAVKVTAPESKPATASTTTSGPATSGPVTSAQSGKMDVPVVPVVDRKKAAAVTDNKKQQTSKQSGAIADLTESEKSFNERASQQIKLPAAKKEKVSPGGNTDDLQTAGAMEAIKLYQGLLKKYPLYKRNDEVMYQLSRAYEDTGQIKKAIKTLDVLVVKYPNSRHIDEAQFRRAEYFFTHKHYIDAEEAYQVVLNMGRGSAFYELALYKQGWSYFKQELYDDALKDYIKMLDQKVQDGYDLSNIKNKIEKKRIDDTYRVISLSFSYLGGADSIEDFFKQVGPREYEANIYSNLGEYYLEKRRYSDAAQTYNRFIQRNPLSKESPLFNIRVIEIYLKGGFPKLVIEAKKKFSITYGLKASYWQYYDIKKFPVVLAYLKTNLTDLAVYYHALFQDKRLYKQKQDNYLEAVRWYRAFLASFPEDEQAPVLNYQLAGLMLENKDYRGAALEYERTAYNYPPHKKSAEAGYAAVFAYRQYFKVAQASDRILVRREIVRSSLKFVETFPDHKNAAVVLAAAADDLYALKDYPMAVKTGRKLIEKYPNADPKLIRSGWLVVAHASFDQANYADAEKGYTQVLAMTAANDKSRSELIENLAASIYKQGEQARKLGKYREAANFFLRVSVVTPTAKIRSTAEYDASAALITLKDWPAAAKELEDFRKRYPENKLQPEITKKLAVVYKEDGKPLQAAGEYERIVSETDNKELKREALQQSADLYVTAKATNDALRVYNHFVEMFPHPIEDAVETRNKMANIYKDSGDHTKYLQQLTIIVDADKHAGKERTDRTRYLAAEAALVLAEPVLKRFYDVKLVKPFKKNLRKKNSRMKAAIDTYGKLLDYQVGDVTAAATYQLAEIYYNFSRSLMNSERPDHLSALELEQYNIMIEDQAYPFEEKAISVHEKNLELLSVGIYNAWIEKSLAKLAVLMPARYAKPEQDSSYVENLVPVKNKQAPMAPGATPPTEKPVAKPDATAAMNGDLQ